MPYSVMLATLSGVAPGLVMWITPKRTLVATVAPTTDRQRPSVPASPSARFVRR
jgi:hypothetical protein